MYSLLRPDDVVRGDDSLSCLSRSFVVFEIGDQIHVVGSATFAGCSSGYRADTAARFPDTVTAMFMPTRHVERQDAAGPRRDRYP